MADITDPNMARLLARRAKEPEPASIASFSDGRGSPDSLNLSFSTGLEEEDEERRQKMEYLSYEAETLGDKNTELEAENQRLRLLVRTRENDIFRLKNELDELKVATTGGGLGSEKAIQRIVELSKKNRDLISQLEAEKNNTRKLSTKLNNVNNQEVQRKLKNAVKAKKEDTASETPSQDIEKALKEKVATLSGKLTEATHQSDNVKQENKLLLKLLQREVGEGANIQSILANPNTWRGRAEQVAVLQSKLTHLKPEETTPTKMEKQRKKDIKTLENNRKQQLQECKKEIETLKEEVNQGKKNYDAVKARNATLGAEMKNLRAQIAALVDKGRNDDALISQLIQEKEDGSWGGGDPGDCTQQLTDRVELLQITVGQKERRISQLEEEITRTREIAMNVQPPPRSGPDSGPPTRSGSGTVSFDVTYLLRAAEVEKDRLFELNEILNQRISELETDKAETDTQLKKNSRQLIDLEKLVENLKCKKLPRCDGCNKPATLLHPPPNSQLSILEDEVAVLKSHVEAISAERQQDMNKYKQMLDQCRQVFIAGMKEFQKSQ